MSSDVQLYQAAARITAPEERERVAQRREAVRRIKEAGRGRTVDAITEEARGMGMAYETMRTLYYKWRGLCRRCGEENADEALVDRRKLPKAGRANLWAQIFQRYCENDKNTSANGWKVMMRDFRLGKADGSAQTYAEVFGAVGTWQDVWARENPHRTVPPEYPSGWVPAGAGYANLMRVAGRNPHRLAQLAACRLGRKAMHRFLVEVLKTRVGLAVGAIRQWDDVWHNTDVRLPQQAQVAQPLEFAGYDVASAYKCDSVIKPRFVRADGKRDNLKEQTFRFAFGASMCVTGFHRDGVTNIVEHGTAAIREPVRRQIALIPRYGPLIRFEQSGILSEQVHAGLFIGCGAGNFRMKPLVESSHGKLADATAHMIGNRGRDAEHLHESQAALVKYDKALMRGAAKLPPDVAAMIEYGLPTFDEYQAAYRIIEREFMRSWEHRLEGWDANHIQEYSVADVPGDNDWHNVRGLLDMEPASARAIAEFLAAHPDHVRSRWLSRMEVWQAGQKDFIRVPLIEMPAFLDERDMIETKVRDNGSVDFRNWYFYGRDMMAYRMSDIRAPDGYTAPPPAPGSRVSVKYNPFCPDQIWIINRDNGATIGMAPLHSRAPMMDKREIEAAMGLQAHDIASKFMPVRGRHQPEAVARAGRMARNQAALLGLAAELPIGNVTVSDDPPDEQGASSDDILDAIDEAAMEFTPAESLV